MPFRPCPVIIVLMLALISIASGCANDQPTPTPTPIIGPKPAVSLNLIDLPPDAPTIKVLFVGNSLTAGNDLPAIVQAMAASAGIRLEYQASTPGGNSLEDQWLNGHARELLAKSPWDHLVLQQGPSTLQESQTNLREWAAKWADEARRLKVKPALYMVWPQRGWKNGFALVSQSYRTAATQARAEIMPTGEAWEAALRDDPAIELYQADGLHPTQAGSYLAALVIVNKLTHGRPGAAPSRLRLASGRTLE